MRQRQETGRRYLLTGAGGFIGGAVARRLLARGDVVYAITRPGRTAPEGCVPLPVSAFEPEVLRGIILPERVHGLVHCAAYGVSPDERDPVAMDIVNVACSQALVDLAQTSGIPRFVMAGTSAEYADDAQCPLEPSQPLQTVRPYGASKARATLSCLEQAQRLGVEALVLRLYNVFGPGEAAHRLLPSLVRGIREGRGADLSVGTQMRDFIPVDLAVTAFTAALDLSSPPAPPIIDICSGEGTSVRQFAEAVGRVMKAGPGSLRFGALPLRPDDLQEIRGDPRGMREILGLPGRFDLDEAIAQAVHHMT
jgi:nucleoside-diphosphate-sugar epimerase